MTRPFRTAPPVVILLLALLAPAGGGAAAGTHAPWPAFRGPHGTGEAAEPLPAGEGALGLALSWKRPLGSGYSGVSIAAGTLVTAFQADGRDVVAAFDPDTGEERWRHELGATHSGHDGSHDGPIATPAIADGRVFMAGARGELVALDLATGRELWRRDLMVDLDCEPPYYGFASSPVVVGGTLVLQVPAPEASLAGFAVETGALVWTSGRDEVSAQSPIVAELGGRRQVVAMGTARVTAVDPADGTILWEWEHGGEPGAMASSTSSPLPLGDDRLFLKHDVPRSAVVAVRPAGDGLGVAELADSRGMARSYSPPTLSSGAVYGFTARFLSAVDPASGDLLWRTRAVGDGFVIAVDGHLVALEKEGTLHLGPASPDGWAATASLDLFQDDLAWTPPSYADGAVYARSLGELARVDVVRAATPARIAAGAGETPEALAALADRIAAGAAPAAAVGAFLASRELPLVDGEDVIFLWRGEAQDVAIGGDMIGMRREEPMRRLAGTDLWWWHTRIDRRARMSYLYFIDYEPTLDPGNPRRVDSTVLGTDMNWNRGEPVEMSWFAMPEWPGRGAAAAPGGTAGEAGGRLDTLELALERTAAEGEEALEPVAAALEVWLPPGYDSGDARYPVVYVHHPAAREHGRWIEALEGAVGDTVAPLIVVFVELPRAPGLGGAFVEQVVPAVDARFRTLAQRDGRANVGMGWRGFSAARITLAHPETFGVLAVQSLYMLDEQMAALESAIADSGAADRPLRIYLEWGRWDLVSPHEAMDFRASSRWAWELFRRHGWQPLGGEVWDSTDFASWRNRTRVLLEAIFPTRQASDGLDRWLTASR